MWYDSTYRFELLIQKYLSTSGLFIQNLAVLSAVLVKSHLTGELLICVSLSPFSSGLVLPSEKCEGIVLHPLLPYNYSVANFGHHC